MKNIFALIIFTLFLYSCQSRIVSQEKPLQANSIELYKKYTVLTNDAKAYKVEVLKQDADKIYTKNKNGEEIVIEKSNIREMKKVDVLASVAIGVAAVAAVIFIPL